jgi:ABC-2 type transport system permease protein
MPVEAFNRDGALVMAAVVLLAAAAAARLVKERDMTV